MLFRDGPTVFEIHCASRMSSHRAWINMTQSSSLVTAAR